MCMCDGCQRELGRVKHKAFYVDALNGKMRTIKDDLHVICRA